MEAGFIPAGSGATGAPLGATAVGSMMAPPASKVIRAPGLKRGKMEEAISDRIKLETVLGLTVNSNAALDCDPNTEMVVYPAGCTIILYDGRKNRQRHIVNAARKCVACVALSSCGRYLAAGESGHAPSVRVWGLREPGAAPVQLVELQGHAHAVTCLAFSMSGKYLVSIGSQHDMIVNVWEWRAGLKLASNKVSSRVKAVSFAESGNYFVTVGFRHVKFWYLEYSRSAKYKEPVPLMGRSAILGEQKDNDFCDVACGRGSAADSTYAITRSGLLCEFNNRRLLDKWVELRTTSANCMSVGTHYIFVGCAEGIVRCFSPSTLQFITTLPRTHYLGVDVSQGTNISHMFSQPSNATYPDAVALTYDEINHKLTVVYNDHSLYVWDVRDIKRVGKSHSALYHSACIWGVDLAPPTAPLPAGSFLTCSSDDTVRVWQLGNTHHHTAAARIPENQHYRANIYSNDLLKVLYVDPELTYLKDVDLSATTEKDKAKSYDDKTGVRCIKISPDGAHVASGDRAGNIRVHSAADASALLTLEAHDAEVLCLEYSGGNGGRPRRLASASRDRLIHVFNVDEDYAFMQTLDDHSSSITAVRFISSGNALQMVSCGADKAILFRQLVNSPSGGYQFAREHNHTGRSTLYDMEVDAGGRHVLTACQDRNIRVYSSAAGRHTKTFRGSVADDGTLIKVALDNSGIYLATSCTDKILSVYDYYSGECMATMYGHSEIVTGLRFTADCQHLISASGDGCIFVWRVPHDMVVTMRARLAQQAIRQGRKVPSSNGACVDSESDSQLGSPPRDAPPHHDALHGVTAPDVPDYTLRIGRLPSWAKKSLGDVADASASPLAPEPPARGKWARRVTADAHIERRLDSDGSKDSSIDSGTDTRMYTEKRTQISSKQVTIVSGKSQSNVAVDFSRSARHFTDDSSLGSFKYEDHESTEHDGDVEDISDGERTSSDHRTTYYPPNNDDNAPGEFTVNAMDVEELRASQRRHKKVRPVPESRLALPIVSVSASISGSGQDSEEDDDEVSTPSGDNADRNPLSGSCESIDTLGRREKFLKSAYESLSGAEIDSGVHGTNTSLSAQHHHQQHTAIAPVAAPRNAALISAARATRADVAKREELNRRIAETRRQLESVGFRSNLKSSQSSTDLSYIPEKESPASRGVGGRPRPISLAVPNSTRHYAAGRGSETEESGGMRRAISLSDLAAKPSPAPRTPVQASGKASSGTNPSGNSSKSSGFVRPASRHNTKTNMTRSSSVGVLNQSDSESDASAAPSSRGGSGMRGGAGLMRPTISSLNKAAANVARRRGLQSAYSSVNLSTVGAEDSSSEAEGGGKPAVPPRPLGQQAPRRAIGARSGSERDLSAKAREVTARLTGGAGGGTRASRANAAPPQDAAATLQGVPDGQLSSALCSQLTEQLTRTADKVVALYRKLQHGAPALDHPHVDNAALINGLETAILETQQVLRGAVSRREPLAPDGVPRARPLSAVASTTHKLEELLAKGVPTANGGLPQDSTISLIEEYSDILLSMMQRNMVASFNQTVSPESLPNPQTGGEHDS